MDVSVAQGFSPAVPARARLHRARRVFSTVFVGRSRHRARNFAGLDADLILAVDDRVKAEAGRHRPPGRVELLGDYAGCAGECVPDPYGDSLEAYRACARQIARLVEAAADRLEPDIGAKA